MLERRPLPRVGGAGQDLQAGVDLQRVGRDRHRTRPSARRRSASAIATRGLADARGPEQRDHLGRWHPRSIVGQWPDGSQSAARTVAPWSDAPGTVRNGHAVAGLSTDPDPLAGAAEAARAAAAHSAATPADLVVVFASGAHLAAPEATLEGIHEELAPGALIGCGAGGVLGDGRELESGTAVVGLGRLVEGRIGAAVSRHRDRAR